MFNLFCGCHHSCQPNPCRCHHVCRENVKPCWHTGCHNRCEEKRSWNEDCDFQNNFNFENNNSWQRGGCDRFEPIFIDNFRSSFGNGCQGLVIINPTDSTQV